MRFSKTGYTPDQLLHLYKELITPRLIEEKMLILLRQGKISKWFSGIGQEAVSVGAVQALEADEYILPMHRNLGVFTGRNIPLNRLFAQFQGKLSGFTKGRDRSFHFGSKEHHIVGMISHLGPQMALADGIALANTLKQEQKATLVFTGDGASSEGDFHEALNVAAVWNLPVIFVIENNGYGLSTPSHEQFKFNSFLDKGPAYGIEAVQVDGNNILEVHRTISKLVKEVRKNPKPVIVEALTFRMRGHEEASGTKYVPKELMEHWAKKDPVENYEQYLLKNGVLTEQLIEEYKAEIKADIDTGLETAYAESLPEFKLETEVGDMFQPFEQEVKTPDSESKSDKRFVDAISDGLKQSLERYDNLVVMGQDIGDYGGVFKITEGFIEKFGRERIRNTPLCESAIIGTGLGLCINGYKAVVEMQFADFVTCGFNQIVNNLAKIHYRWNQNADVVVRMPTGAGVGAGPFHSQSNEAWFFHTPGLKIVYPSNPYDAKGLLNAAIEEPNPYMFFEHKALYRSLSQEIPDDYYTIEVGKAAITQEGEDISIITYGMGVHWAKALSEELKEISIEVIDLRTLSPWDSETVAESVKKTNKALVLHEDTMIGGIGAEVSAWISEHLFEHLDAPVARIASLDTPVPFTKTLEENFLPIKRLKEKVIDLNSY
ncbi:MULTISPECIES: alpha-ketoacid dehydrogenase subunit alpha/beta [Roseivirga]|uniref:Dehydrogenase n=1 Tax=Roseivirga spongicola TaxID=333140 RepID=A0A150XIC4_9BACT|nr:MULTISPECIES: dehydrogenase E1 component subunit alpha/beta [Roseivirga]KYG78454.1 dehydrogenase [Roseivirga spongicola]MBO6660721.1 dehydrogenase E1 component subunit alpha/beta [Roseivirga sp.]MBO6761636.1 dehydrogenase E1 component subunit alpha/beta [Roseivirga sp.]MBO6909295.1 dehydrogenase E1 component subunit alpha/beta [Roseivirga sp.]WPZ12203.1 dehydrogenase E1 component subunit alpha/beta [Roseivirga spongicola]